MPSEIIVIINPAAGAGAASKAGDRLAEQFRAAGVDSQIVSARTRNKFIAAAERAAGASPRIVVAGGGDGTVSAVASRLVGTGIALGVLPLGTLNHFACDLGIPPDIEEAAKIIIAGNVGTVDAGEVNGHVFLNNSSLGIYPEIVRDREKQQKRQGAGNWPAFVRATLAVLHRHPFMDVRLRVNGEDRRRRTPFVLIGNNEYRMESLDGGCRARIDAGKLSLYLTRHRGSRWGLLKLAAKALLGTLRQATEFEALTATDFLIETRRRRLKVAMDGEVTVMATPLRYRIRPGALRVIVPVPVPKPAGGT